MSLNTLDIVWAHVLFDTVILVLVCPSFLDKSRSPCSENCRDCAPAVGSSNGLPEADGEEAGLPSHGINSRPCGAVLLPSIDVCQENSPPCGAVLLLARSSSDVVRLLFFFGYYFEGKRGAAFNS